MLEVQKNFDNYVDKKDITWSCLDGIKGHAKLVSLGETIDAFANMDTDQVELRRFLYKLYFQQLLLLESYTKLLQLLSVAAGSSGVVDMPEQVATVCSNLLTALADTLTPPTSPGYAPGTPNKASTPFHGSGDSRTPQASPPVAASSEEREPTPTASTSEAEDGPEEGDQAEALFIPSNENSAVVLPEISLTPPIRYCFLNVYELFLFINNRFM